MKPIFLVSIRDNLIKGAHSHFVQPQKKMFHFIAKKEFSMKKVRHIMMVCNIMERHKNGFSSFFQFQANGLRTQYWI